MSKEKITIERFIEETFLICDVSGVGQVKTMKPEMKRIINVLLTQIRNDLKEERFKVYNIVPLQYSPLAIYDSDIENVFNKYLTGKGGK